MPSMFIEGHSKKVEEFIKSSHLNKNSEKGSFRGIEKKKIFILIKSKMGYLIPFNAKCTVFDDNDFSNNFIIKAHLLQSETKSMYAYYILTKNDFIVDSISSSAIHLGFSMDLLKKYVIKLNLLIRTSKDMNINLFEKYTVFEEEPKKIIWVFPDKIYPKNNSIKRKEEKIDDLIRISHKKKLNLQIIEMKYKEGEIIGFIFKFFEIQSKIKNETYSQGLIPSFKNEIIFDLLNLNYIRTVIVDKKSGLRNLREKDQNFESIKSINKKINEKKTRKSDLYYDLSENSSGFGEFTEILLTKEKIMELQTKDSNGIESFINLLPFYGEDISLIKQRPNKEQYLSGKVREPKIRIDVNKFINRMYFRIKIISTSYISVKKSQRESLILNENKGIKNNSISSIIVKHNETHTSNEKDEINKEIIGDYTLTLVNIFSKKNIKTLKLVDLCIFIIVISFIIIDFYFMKLYLSNYKTKFLNMDNSYKILSNILYTKYFVTEAIITNTIQNYIISDIIGKINYLNYIKKELANLHDEFINLYESFNALKEKFSKQFTNYISYTNFTIKTLNNGNPKYEILPFISIMNKLSTSVYYLSTIPDLESINMNNKYSYELMLNLINIYYYAFVNASILIFEDMNESTKNPCFIINIIILLSLIISVLSVLLFYNIITKLLIDREKPINLFLTIKKKLFEFLKISTENFSNKILNKFFGNEENEEESQQEYKRNINTNDINISKFKAFHENNINKTYKKGGALFSYLFQLICFLFIFELYLILKFFNFRRFFSQVYEYNNIYNTTNLSHILIVIRINIVKQYLFNKTLPQSMLNEELDSINHSFSNSFFHLSTQLARTIFETYKVNNFLKGEYKNFFEKYINNDFSKIIENEGIKNNSFFNKRIKYGYKPVAMEAIELFRSLLIQYYLEIERNNNMTNLLINDEKWYDLHQLLINLVKKWNHEIIEEMNSCFYSMIDNLETIYLSLFILIIILIILSYCIIWKSYEEKFYNILIKSYDLINLIPKEIKSIIISKLNE